MSFFLLQQLLHGTIFAISIKVEYCSILVRLKMINDGKANRIDLFNFKTAPMRAFHMTWIAFFLCFFAWFAAAPLMPVIRKEMALTDSQIGNIIIASSATTIFARLLIGWLADKLGPRIVYTWLLALGSLPVVCLGFAQDYQSFLIFRLMIGAIGASFVLTQYHTTLMFSSRCVGTANATTAGWGNLGGGVTQILMPLIFSGFLFLGFSESIGWRLAMVIPGTMMFFGAFAYYRFTQDTPLGNFTDLAREGKSIPAGKAKGRLRDSIKDYRVLVLSAAYGASFGLEITVHNMAGLYFVDEFKMGLKEAGLIVGCFGLLAIFARTLGGWISDLIAVKGGIQGRAAVLGFFLLLEGVFLMLFSQATPLPFAVTLLIIFGLFVHACCGATYAIIPFINKKAVGSVAGIVGAGGNLGAVFSGFLFKGALPWTSALLLLGVFATACSLLLLSLKFSKFKEEEISFNTDDLLAKVAG
ncbi:MAG: MFS transporter [Gemmataceae bacterium]|nr:MFS transporter [Gemmataceae bacterium]